MNPAGALCDICPLSRDRSGGPVAGAGAPASPWVVVGEAPGAYEVQEGVPFVGPSGRVLDEMLRDAGMPRSHWRTTNVLLCRPPIGLSLEDYLDRIRQHNAEIRRDNRIRKGLKEPLVPEVADPRTCCRNRLLRDIRGSRGILALGSQAARAITSHGQILRWRGSPLRVQIPPPSSDGGGLAEVPSPIAPATDAGSRQAGEVWALPTLHPAFAMRGGEGEAFAQVIALDVVKAVRIFKADHTEWDESGMRGPATTAEGVIALCREAMASRRVALDVETTGDHVLKTRLICVGLAWPTGVPFGHPGSEAAAVIPILDPVTLAPVWGPEDAGRVHQALSELLEDDTVEIVAHNGAYDRAVLDRAGFPITRPWEDTMIAHHGVVSDHPHGLGFVATMYTDARYWKDDVREGGKLNSQRVDPAVFYTYNQRDCLATLRVWPAVHRDLEADGQLDVYEQGLALADIARRMQAWGMRVDVAAGAAISQELQAREAECKAQMAEMVSHTDYKERMLGRAAKAPDKARRKRLERDAETFNPGGQVALREALQALGVPIPERTPTGLMATGKQILADAAPKATPAGREFIRLLTNSPRDKNAALHQFGWRPALKLRTTYIDKLPVHEDGRIHPDFNVIGTVTGRFAHRHPNVSNWPKWIRKIVVPDWLCVFVGTDFKQLEWRASAHLSGDPALLAVFSSGRDPHREAAAQVFRKPPEAVTSIERDFWKRVLYALSYGGTWETAYNSLRTEFPEVRPSEIEEVFHRILREFPVWMRWRDNIAAEGRRKGFLRSPILGRRRYFRGSKVTEVLNFPAQSLAADVINAGTIRIWDAMVARYPEWRLIDQIHDALLFEVPEADAGACEQLILDILPGPYRIRGVADPVTFPVETKVGLTWAVV